jgi:hypothetical protein
VNLAGAPGLSLVVLVDGVAKPAPVWLLRLHQPRSKQSGKPINATIKRNASEIQCDRGWSNKPGDELK